MVSFPVPTGSAFHFPVFPLPHLVQFSSNLQPDEVKTESRSPSLGELDHLGQNRQVARFSTSTDTRPRLIVESQSPYQVRSRWGVPRRHPAGRTRDQARDQGFSRRPSTRGHGASFRGGYAANPNLRYQGANRESRQNSHHRQFGPPGVDARRLATDTRAPPTGTRARVQGTQRELSFGNYHRVRRTSNFYRDTFRRASCGTS